MAPSRRRGSARAAAAAAARQKWKVGDLVLAKMKGFPPWPATVSEPEKWGYSSDRKKVLVFFYGTEQIAFCNHADLEAFTEEKKKVLLNKRHGKGADFVRAVNEIIDIYDSLKNKTLDEVGSGESFRKSPESNSQTTHNFQSESLYTSSETIDVRNSEETLGASAKAELCSIDGVSRDSTETVSILDQLRQTSLAPINSRKRLRDTSQQSCGVQRKAPSLLRCRSSSAVDPCKSEKPNVQSIDADQSCGDLMTTTLQEGVIVRNKPICAEQNRSGCCDADLHISTNLISCQRTEDVESEIVVRGDGAAHLNECGLLESNFKLEQLESGYLGKDNMFSGKLDSSMKAVILKKKRKPNRKRATNATECVKLDNEVELQNDQRENLPDSPNSYKETIQTCWKANGDEHLPLVKRARVRMEKLHVEQVTTNEIVGPINKKEEAPVHSTDKHVISSKFEGCPADKVSPEVRDFVSNLPTNDCTPRDDFIFWKDCKFQDNGGNLDFEAALPPSKRLHRALKAMSANAADTLDDSPQRSKAIDIVSNCCMDLPGENSLNVLTDGKILSCTKLQNLPLSDSNISNKALRSPSNLASQLPKDLEVPILTSSKLKPDGGPHNNDFSSSICKMIDSQTHTQTLQTSCILSSDTQVNAASSELVTDKSSVREENGLLQLIGGLSKKGGVVATVQKLDSGLNSRESDGILLLKASGEVPTVENATFVSDILSQATSSSRSDGNSGSRDMQEVTKDVKLKTNPKDMGFSTDMTPMKILIAAAQAKRLLSRSASFTDTDGKVVPYAAVSPSLNHGDHSSEQGSSLNSMMYHRPTSDDRAHLFTNGNRSPQNSMQEKGLNKLRGLEEANVSRKSFEAILCTLSRTKESIGRATRFALDCAKYGIAEEVIDILLKHLERESSLYRRIDLFFLVDSITQCSHNQKGGAGDVYPSLVQSVLSRLLSAAAPPGNAASENRKQCIKVLKLWLERKILPESIVQHHMKELGFVYENVFSTMFSRRPSRTERSVDDPVRGMEGMLVDEYGSNTCFQLPGLLSRSVLEDEEEGSACEEKSFEAVTPERDSKAKGEKETTNTCISSKRRHILEDVDGELEMEDLAPPCEVEVSSNSYATGVDTVGTPHYKFDQQHSLPFAPPLPEDKPPSPPPLPSSPPPAAPSSSSPLHVSRVSHALPDAAGMQLLDVKQNLQNQLTQPCNQNSNMMPPEPVRCCVSGYGEPQKQIPPVSSLSSSGSYRNVSHHAMHSGTGIQPSVTVPSPNVAYRVQPPLPTLSNQFSYVQDESNKSVQSWETRSCFTSGFHLVNNKQGGNFYEKGGPKVPIKHEVAKMGGFSPAAPPGPQLPGKIEASHIALPYGPSPEPSSNPCRGWSFPPRAPSYNSSYSRPTLHSMSRVTGEPGCWRPR